MGCKHLVGIKCKFQKSLETERQENYLSVLTGASDNFLISFPSRFYSLKWKACQGWCNFINWQEAQIYILWLSVPTISPHPVPSAGALHTPLAQGFLGTSPPLHWLIFFNEGKDFSSALWHSQTLLQQVWSLWWFCIWCFVCCLFSFFKKLWIILSWNTLSSHLLVKPIVIVPFSLPQICWSSFFPSIYFCLLSIPWSCSYKNHLLPLLHLIKLQGPINGIKQTPWGMITSLDDSQTPFFLFLYGSSTLAKNSCSALCMPTESSCSQWMIFGATTDFASADLVLDRSQPISWIRILRAEQRPVSINHDGKLVPNILLPHMISAVIKLSYVTYAGALAGAKISSGLSVFRSI